MNYPLYQSEFSRETEPIECKGIYIIHTREGLHIHAYTQTHICLHMLELAHIIATVVKLEIHRAGRQLATQEKLMLQL